MHAVTGSRFFRISAVALTLGSAGCGDDSTAPPAAAKLAFKTQPSSNVAGRVFSPAIVIEIQDQNGAVASGANVDVQITVSANGTVGGITTARAAGGIANFPDLRVNSAGLGYTLTASAPGVQSATSNAFDITPGPATRLAFLVQPVTAIANTTLPVFAVAVQDAFGNTVKTASQSIGLSLGSNAAGAFLDGEVSAVPVNGVSTFTGTRVTKPAAGLRILAQSGNVTSILSNPFDATSGPATTLTFSAQPVTTNPGRAMNDVTVIVSDAAGNQIASANASVTLSIGNNQSGATLSGTTTKATSGGSVTFTGLSVDKIGSGYTLIASATGLANGTSAAFDVRNPLNFMAVNSGYFHTCGLTTTNITYCWGSNSLLALGIPDPTLTRTVPVAIAGSFTFDRISAGRDHNCATTTGGVAYCWGNYGAGQLGPAATPPATPTPTVVTSQISFASVDAGYSHSCGLTSAGVAYCWGSNGNGELGNSPSFETATPSLVAGGFTFTSLSPGRVFTCGIRTGGAAYCWGDNSASELGIGTTGNRSTPVAVAGGLSFTTISAGGFHACGLTASGAAYCWGQNVFGQLGDNSATNRNAPVAVAGGLIFASISAGNRHTCGVTTAGAGYCWGENIEGKLGVGGNTTSVTPLPVAGGLVFRSISAGRFHTCGVTTAGLAYCWGSNSNGTLGDGTTADAATPVAVR